MHCYPKCDVHVNKPYGNMTVKTKLDVCQKSPTLTFHIKSSGSKFSTHAFVAGNEMEIRPMLNTYHEQLNLQVKYTQTQNGAHHVLAGFEEIKSGNITYFMNDTISVDASTCIQNGKNSAGNSEFLWVLLCIILFTCLFFIGISFFTIFKNFIYSNFRKTRKMSITSPKRNVNHCTVMINQPNTYLLSPNARLAVIAEVEEKDLVSEASIRESSNSLSQRVEHEKRRLSSDSINNKPAQSIQKTSFICQKDQVILPREMTFARRNSQPFIFPVSSSLDSLKSKQMAM